MAEATAFRNNALPYPVYGCPWVVVFPVLDEDGDPVTGATCDSEVSKNGDTAVDCTNEGVEIGFDTATNKGMYYLILTAAEMTADIVCVTVYGGATTTQATCITLYPRKLVSLRAGTSQGGAAGYITLDASAGANDDTWNNCLCVATIDSNIEARILTDYTGGNQQAAVVPEWNVAPDADDTFVLYLPEGMQRPVVNAIQVSGTVQTARDLGASVLLAADQHTIVDSGTVTTLSNLPAAPEDWLDAAAVKADAVIKIQDGLATPTNITAATGIVTASGTVTTLTNLPAAPANWLDAASVDAGTVTKIQSGLELTGAAAAALTAYDPPTNTEMVAAFTEIKGATWAATDTLEAIRDRGDAAWITATGFASATYWTEALAGVITTNLDGKISDIADAVWTDEARALTDKAGFTLTGLTDASAAKLDDVLDGTGGVTLSANITGNLTGNITGNITGNLSGTVASLSGLIDGETHSTLLAAIMAAVGGVSVITGATVSFKKRNGTTEALSVTYDEDDNRTVSTIP